MEVTAMTEPQGIESITEADVAAFAQKLESWGKELSPKEQTLLRRLIARAVGIADADQDVQGYFYGHGRLPRLFNFLTRYSWWLPQTQQPGSSGGASGNVSMPRNV
jgi:hypothetical protein